MALNFAQLAEERPWAAELIVAGVALLLGLTLMPVLIFYAGVAALGRFDGASLGHLYSSLFAGFKEASLPPGWCFSAPTAYTCCLRHCAAGGGPALD